MLRSSCTIVVTREQKVLAIGMDDEDEDDNRTNCVVAEK
jgi:hypothetical protein